MKDFFIGILEILEQIKTLDLIIGLVLLGIIFIAIVTSSKTRKSLPAVFSSAYGLYKSIIFQNKFIGIVFLCILITVSSNIYLLTNSVITALLFLVIPFKIIYKEVKSIVEDNNMSLLKSYFSVFWEFEKSFLEYCITYYLVLFKLPSEIKKIINYGFKDFIKGIFKGDLNIIFVLIILSCLVSGIISIFIIDVKRFASIELDILAVNRKSKYTKLSKFQIQRIIIGTKYFRNVKIKSDILKIIAGFNKFEFKDFSKLLKSSVKLYSYLNIKNSERKIFLLFLDKLLHCCDESDIYLKSVKQIRKGSKDKTNELMKNIDDFWEQKCLSYICYNKKQECLDLILKEIQK